MTTSARDRRPRAPYRVERALTAGLLCGPGGAVAHVAAGGAPPSAGMLALVSAVALLGAAAGSSRRLGWPTLLALAGGAQLAFHHLLGAAAPAGHGMDHGAADGGASMVLAHLLVAVLVAVVARGAEASWWSIACAALLRLLPPMPAAPRSAPVPVPARASYGARRPVVWGTRDVVQVVGPRGPPAGRALAPVPA